MRTTLVSAVVVAALALPAAAQGAGFTLGVAAGDVSSSSAILWAHSSDAGLVKLRVRRGGRVVQHHSISSDPAEDNTVRVYVRHLRPATRYSYQFFMGKAASKVGKFRTAPPPGRRRTIRFAYSGDADGTLNPATGKPLFNFFEVYKRMRAERNDFNVNLGDTIYSDPEVGDFRPPPALTLAEKWAKYHQNLSFSNLYELRRSGALYGHWDDHEFRNDFSPPEFANELYQVGRQAFLDYWPVSYSPETGLYRHFRWGKNAEVFFLDERSFRSAKASDGTACDNPYGRFSDDLAPTAPQRLRNVFGQAIAPLKNPTPQACLDLIADPNRTLLGAAQLARFMHDVSHSHAKFKLILNETPIQQFYALPYDRWEGYAAERLKLLTFLKEKVKNVVFLTTDTHANMVNDVRFQTLEPGGPKNSGILEVVTGPVATNTFDREIDTAVGINGAGATIGRAFFKPAPPLGVGMKCVALDVYSYAEVKVTSRSVTVTPKDSKGKLVQQPGAPPCGPFRVKAR